MGACLSRDNAESKEQEVHDHSKDQKHENKEQDVKLAKEGDKNKGQNNPNSNKQANEKSNESKDENQEVAQIRESDMIEISQQPEEIVEKTKKKGRAVVQSKIEDLNNQLQDNQAIQSVSALLAKPEVKEQLENVSSNITETLNNKKPEEKTMEESVTSSNPPAKNQNTLITPEKIEAAKEKLAEVASNPEVKEQLNNLSSKLGFSNQKNQSEESKVKEASSNLEEKKESSFLEKAALAKEKLTELSENPEVAKHLESITSKISTTKSNSESQEVSTEKDKNTNQISVDKLTAAKDNVSEFINKPEVITAKEKITELVSKPEVKHEIDAFASKIGLTGQNSNSIETKAEEKKETQKETETHAKDKLTEVKEKISELSQNPEVKSQIENLASKVGLIENPEKREANPEQKSESVEKPKDNIQIGKEKLAELANNEEVKQQIGNLASKFGLGFSKNESEEVLNNNTTHSEDNQNKETKVEAVKEKISELVQNPEVKQIIETGLSKSEELGLKGNLLTEAQKILKKEDPLEFAKQESFEDYKNKVTKESPNSQTKGSNTKESLKELANNENVINAANALKEKVSFEEYMSKAKNSKAAPIISETLSSQTPEVLNTLKEIPVVKEFVPTNQVEETKNDEPKIEETPLEQGTSSPRKKKKRNTRKLDRSESQLDAEEKEDPPIIPGIDNKKIQIYLFYIAKINGPNSERIDDILKRYSENSEVFEKEDLALPWLFPVLVSSEEGAPLLSTEDIGYLRDSKEAAERFVQAYELFLDFFGLKLSDKSSGLIQRKDNYLSRYQATLIGKTQHFAKIRRVLNSLNVLGFNKYAFELTKYFEIEIYGEEGGYDKYQSSSKKTRNTLLPNFSTSPLNNLGGNSEAFRVWKPFGDFGTDAKKITDFENSTGLKASECKQNIYLI